ncbi:hypothetical protein, partial [Bilophila wadsworthia]|uniref:hypothetical protein n=1 Tax=Bilophila wadsworthia TaxID=35833 RepID=UPI003AB7337C
VADESAAYMEKVGALVDEKMTQLQVEVGGSFEVDFHDSDSISLVLWRHARIDTLRHSSREITLLIDKNFVPAGS